jgi:hypothetical protein
MSETVANVWADEDPHEALALLREMYEEGPEPKRALALRLFILLPRERAEEYLYSRLRGEKEPTRRIELLRELVEIGASMTLPLLERVADPAEDALVRIYAAQSLAERPSLEMQTESVLRELVRVSRAPMPEPARGCIHELLENLRERTPESVSRWEALANPYTPGRPVNNPEMFFGREALLHELRVGVENGTHMLLHGEPRIGKTSLLRMLEMKLQEEAARGAPVRSTFLDLQGLRENEFYETLVRAIIEQLRDPELVADSEIERPYTDTAFERDLAGLMEYLRGKHGERVRLAVLLDEADTLSSYALPMQSALRRILRAKEMNGLTLVLAGSPAVQEWQRPPSPLAGLFALRPVTRLSAESAARLITRPVAEAFTYQPAALTAVQRATTGRPYDIHALCQKLVNGMLSGSGQVITEEMVNQALQNSMGGRGNLLANADSVLAALIDWVESHPQANNAQVQERIQSAWQELLPLMINQVAQVRKGAK